MWHALDPHRCANACHTLKTRSAGPSATVSRLRDTGPGLRIGPCPRGHVGTPRRAVNHLTASPARAQKRVARRCGTMCGTMWHACAARMRATRQEGPPALPVLVEVLLGCGRRQGCVRAIREDSRPLAHPPPPPLCGAGAPVRVGNGVARGCGTHGPNRRFPSRVPEGRWTPMRGTMDPPYAQATPSHRGAALPRLYPVFTCGMCC